MHRVLLSCLALLPSAAATAEDWPQWRGPKRDNVWASGKLPDRLPEKLEPLWRRPIGGGYGGIAVANERVFVMDHQTKPNEVERILCLNSTKGDILWKHTYPVRYEKLDYGNGPRATPTIQEGRVYAYGALGHLHCLDAASGKVLWNRDMVRDFKGRTPTWGQASSPLIDGGRVIVQVGGQPNAGLVALDAVTGKEAWRSLDDRPGYASPVIIQTHRWRQLVYFTPEHVVGLEPETGKVLWKVPFDGITYDVAIPDVVCTDGVLLASNYWSGSKAIRFDEKGRAPEVVWEGKQLSLVMSTPLVRDGLVYALDRHRGLECLDIKTGKVRWQDVQVTPRGNNPQASLVWVDAPRALILNARGELVLVELTSQRCRTLSKVPVIGPTRAHPAYANGCVFARNDDEIVCVRLVK